MKKLICVLLALIFVLSLGTMAFASSEPVTFNFEKTYTLTGGTAIPGETLKFTVSKANTNPDDTMITVADHTVTGTDNPQTIAVTIPQTYSKVGKYNYTVTEQAGNTQGVTYSTTSFDVQVFVSNDADNDGLLETQVVFTTSDGKQGKIDGIENTYNMGSLTVEKKIDGNLASSTQKFSIDVTFTAEEGKVVRSPISYGGNKTISVEDMADGKQTVTIELAANETCTFANIPAGVTYSVVEQAKHTVADANGSNPETGYTVSYSTFDGKISTGDTDKVTVTNTKGTTVDTGIGLDSLPYIMLLVLAAAGLIVFFSKKRMAREN